ncbi:hypothetical protein [Neoasaia chiangmaiensis]|uniref:Uncharacterized protein n=1 Tax=Neoasaia chiangmaiensis TaxID=320497 RepID=A0A1U9KQW6_9PROT|nr:hypothetical protein [Neoasaia chiangmaiensis]AQS88137.1 hypothetical protein A0U93_09500 [Neoasaia chiangmaiensis]
MLVNQNRTNTANDSLAIVTRRSMRSNCRVIRSSRRANAASSRSGPSGERKDASAVSTISACGTFLRVA